MQIRELVVDNHKCLVDFKIKFQITNGGSSTILIGENGTGKSTMMETVLEILMSFDSDAVEKKIDYSYELEYLYAGSIVSIYQTDKYYKIDIDHENLCNGKIDTVKAYLRDKERSIFPKRVNYFYSGLNCKEINPINRINLNYEKLCRKELTKYWRAVVWAGQEYNGNFPKRKYVFCSEKYVSIYLTAILCGGNSFEKRYLQEQNHFDCVEDVTLSLNTEKLPIALQKELTGSSGEWMYEIIDFLDDSFTDAFKNGFLYQNENIIYFELKNIAEINADSTAIFDFFDRLVALFDAEYSVYVSIGGQRVNCRDLSEGQRQLIKILGLLGVCKSEDMLVLMDEPDAHMNPKWKYELKQTIDNCLKSATNTQALIATHDPLVINGVEKEFIRLFTFNQSIVDSNGWYYAKVREPSEDTAGMGIDGLLQSEYYGLQTSYDKESNDKFVKRQELYIKLINKTATEEEQQDLRQLTKEIGSLPMSYNSIDFLYDDFIKVYMKSDLYTKEYLSYEDIQRRRKLIQEIISKLYEGAICDI